MKSNGVTLNLSKREAKALAIVCLNIGGDPKGTRGLLDNIYRKLTPTRPKWGAEAVNATLHDRFHSLYFNP